MKIDLHGIMPPHITPFSSDGVLDEPALRQCVDFWVEGGVHGLAPCGSNGEAPLMNRDERRRVIEVVVDQVDGRVPVVAGTGDISTHKTIDLTRDAKDAEADAALIVTPFYYRPSGEEIFRHYMHIMDAVDIPIILYNVPKFTGYPVDPETVARLADESELLIGIKDSSGSITQIYELIRLVGKKIAVLAGSADTILPTLIGGGKGAIVAVANVAPKMCTELYEAYVRKDLDTARELQIRLSLLNSALMTGYGQISAIKRALTLLGKPSGLPRMPLLPLDNRADQHLSSVLVELGLI